jgi:hypothetical protein
MVERFRIIHRWETLPQRQKVVFDIHHNLANFRTDLRFSCRILYQVSFSEEGNIC